LQKAFGTKLNFSSSYHPETDGQTERVNQILEDMLRAYILDFQGKWEEYLPLVEFSYNNSYQSTIHMAPFEALYGRKCRTPLCWSEIDKALIIGPKLIQETTEKSSKDSGVYQNCPKPSEELYRSEVKTIEIPSWR